MYEKHHHTVSVIDFILKLFSLKFRDLMLN